MRRPSFFLVFLTALFIISYNFWYFLLREAKGATWHETLLRGGIVVDGSGRKAYPADVLIRGAKIAAVGREIEPSPGTRVIDVRGALLLPGFVALRPGLLPQEEKQKEFIRAGVTTVIGGGDGNAPGEIEKHLNLVAQSNPRLNYGILFGLGTLRGIVQKGSWPISPPALETLRGLAQKGLAEGALGFSLDLNSLPGACWTWEETEKVLADFTPPPLLVLGLPEEVFFQENKLLEVLQEVIREARHIPFQPYLRHFRLPKGVSPDLAANVSGELKRAAAAGVEVRGDLNPFLLTGGPRDRFDRTLGRFDPGDLVFAGVPEELAELRGKSLAGAARERGLPAAALARQLQGKELQVELNEAGGEKALASLSSFCWQAVYADSGEAPRPYLNLLREEEGRLGARPLEEKVWRLSFLPARFFRLEGRGMLAPSYYADILVVRRTGEEHVLEYVFVNGKPALREGLLTEVRSGNVLRGR